MVAIRWGTSYKYKLWGGICADIRSIEEDQSKSDDVSPRNGSDHVVFVFIYDVHR
jgi:hypothetical protein